jgi:4-hydroxy-3-polyprenylbenzoate decarboxylase
MHGLWGMGQMMFSKYIVVVDEDCDVHNTSEVLFRSVREHGSGAR